MAEKGRTIRERLASPSEFRLGLAIPVALEHGVSDPVGSRQRTFMRGAGEETRASTMARARELLQLAGEVMGASAVRLLRTGGDFCRLFEGKPAVVIVVGHAPDGERVELLDEDLHYVELSAAVPRSFAGLLDLRICDAEVGVADRVRASCPQCVVRAAAGVLDFREVAWSLGYTLKLVVGDRMPYDDAARLAHAELRRINQKRRRSS